jgi:hypothetical protein
MRPYSCLRAATLLLAALTVHTTAAAQAGRPDTTADSAAGKVYYAELMLEAQRLRMPNDSVGRAKAFEESARIAAEGANAYRLLAADPRAVGKVLEQALTGFYTSKAGARGAVQISQSADEQQIRLSLLRAAQEARIIEQNDRIIQLLEQIAKKK